MGTSTGEIRTKRRMSDNDLKSHPLVVLVSDNGEPSLSATVSIDVVVVESTADIQTQFRHVNSVKSYKLSQNEYFSLDVQSGGEHGVSAELVIQKALDREKRPLINLILTAVDGGKSARSGTMNINVNVLDVNDNTPMFSKSLYKARVRENTAHGTVVMQVNATDLDEGLNGKILYSFIKRGNTDPSNVFDLNSETGEITVKGTLDYEETAHAKLDKDGGNNGVTHCEVVGSVPFKLQSNYKNDYSLVVDRPLDRENTSLYNVTITATDEGSPALSSMTVVTVHVSDVNDNAPRFMEPVINIFVKENIQIGSIIYTIHAFDPDLDKNAKLTYTLLNSSPRNVPISSIVNINSETGDIISLQSFNYEELKTFQFKVQATDSGVPLLSSNVTVNVFILDENDNNPTILAPYSEHGSVNSESIPYSAEAGYFVAKVRAVDADSGYNALLSYHLSDGGEHGVSAELVLQKPLDREKQSAITFVLTAVDGGKPPRSGSLNIHVNVLDVNDNIPTFSKSLYKARVPENTTRGTVVIQLNATDLDEGLNGKILNSDSLPLSTMININSETGDIVSLQSFNFEELKTFQFKVQATDSGVPPLSSNMTVNVFILDENDNSPSILAPYSEHGSVNSESIPYSAEAGYFVAKVRAVDADSGYNALLSYHLSEPKGNNLFRMGTSTGEIRTRRRMSDNDLKSHPLVVLVSDNGEPSLSATVSIDVVVVESTADIQTQFRHVPIKEESFSDLNLYLSDTLKSDVVVFPAAFPPVDAELISINGGDTYTRTQTLPTKEKVRDTKKTLSNSAFV
uniref:Cadherin domain-containing protein n=1 Tax=Mola mola TaxID=94237 RepID=A0A3Q3VLL1_MOLML